MRTNFTLALALTDGFVGGLASRYWSPHRYTHKRPGRHQLKYGPTNPLVDENGIARGVFGLETNGSSFVEITDGKGRVYTARWYPTRTRDFFHDPPFTPRETTLLP